MAKVWFARSGRNPTTGEADYDLPLSECVKRLGLAASHYWSDLDTTPRFAQPTGLDGITSPEHVVVEVEQAEASARGWKSGFYYLSNMSVPQAKKQIAE
ncbi:hypothetical protein JQ554_28650 [Bradyrhizobium diazoefficiens]|nr:hypothetical protein [Bradyrhizobium diazoefficiens]UCF51335.1 MAG: hypothetical protein JSV48_17870 [Bradyrhizobium sp.]MBR0968066.1 hypothetical protein [Bradyrhizobium diazoefficiens]MBR0981463.1 hypothetical protein [Bradyrhizobium diazoefficiens]MBR1010916.1 hypothetical protein [Bradyrhizobium diazoefficiens]MBR1017416.1 hypothetical protein [Bradyrhizobium diazoefficiens]